MANVVLQTEGVQIDARGALGMLRRMTQDELPKGKLKALIRKELNAAAKTVRKSAKTAMRKDPRRASSAVKVMVYKGRKGKSMGGNISILDRKGAKKVAEWVKPKKRITRNRQRTERTKTIDGYRGRDRAFILRFINSGTQMREAGKKSPNMRTRANRGMISARHFFGDTSKSALNAAAANLKGSIAALIRDVANGKS